MSDSPTRKDRIGPEQQADDARKSTVRVPRSSPAYRRAFRDHPLVPPAGMRAQEEWRKVEVERREWAAMAAKVASTTKASRPLRKVPSGRVEALSLPRKRKAAKARAGADRNPPTRTQEGQATRPAVAPSAGDAGPTPNDAGYPTRDQVEAERERRIAAGELYGYRQLARQFRVQPNVIRRRLGKLK